MVRRSILVSGDDEFNKLLPPERTLDLNMTVESKDQTYVRTTQKSNYLRDRLLQCTPCAWDRALGYYIVDAICIILKF